MENAPLGRDIKEVVQDEWNKLKPVLREDLRNQESRFYERIAAEELEEAQERDGISVRLSESVEQDISQNQA